MARQRQQGTQGEAWWGGLLAAFAQQDSVSVASFCNAHRVTVAQFQYQRRKLLARQLAVRPMESTPTFREYALPAPLPNEQAASCGIRVHLGEVVIELLPGFDPAALRLVLSCCR